MLKSSLLKGFVKQTSEQSSKKAADDLTVANKEIAFQNEEKENRAAELMIANKELIYQNAEKGKRAAELAIANEELLFQNNEKEKRAAELVIANKELSFQSEEKEQRAAELVIANEELLFQNDEKEKRAAELAIANQELLFQNSEKEKRAAELAIANEELLFQNSEKEKRAAELVIANLELLFQSNEKEKRAQELAVANKELLFQNNEKEKRAAELIIANKELAFQNLEKEKRAAEVIIAGKELIVQNEEKAKRVTELNKASHLYAFISQIKQDILYVKDEEALFHNACQIAIEFGKFKIAWIGLYDKENETVTLVEQIGIIAEDIKRFNDIPLRATSAQHYILHTGNYHICNDILNSPEMESWRSVAVKQGVCSSMVLAIKKAGSIIGTFNLYAAESNFFSTEEIELLTELAADISFALDIFEKEKALKRAQELMVQNERRFRVLIEKSADMITLSTIGGKFIYGSNSIMKGLGYSEEELFKISVFDIIHPDEISETVKNRDKILRNHGGSFYYQQRRRHKNGSWIWCEGTLTNMLHEPGINALVSNFRNITEKKLAEEGLLLTQFAIDNAGDAIFWMTPDARIFNVNEAACVMLGYSRPEMVELSVPDIDPHYNANKWHIHFSELRQKGSLFFETVQQAKNGRLIPVEIRANYIKFGDAEFNCAFSRDISERKIAEGNLIKSETKLKEAQAIAHIGNFEIDLENFSEVWSDQMYNILGVEKKVAPSDKLFSSFIHPDDIKLCRDAFLSCQDASMDYRLIRKDGVVRYANSEWRFEFDNNSKPVRLYGVLQDITDRKLAEIERIKMVNDLVLRNTELEQFGYIISHNLRSPVANIIGAVSVLNDPDLNTEDKEVLSKGISDSVKKLDNVVQDLNNILQVKGEISNNKEIVHFSELVDDIKTSIKNLIDKNSITIKHDFSEINGLLTIKSYMYSVFYNLISNSIKYRRQHIPSFIVIESRLEKNKMELIFADNGMGINLNKNGGDVFGLYKRFHNHIEGKGMGLFMVKTQVETLGGKISIKSTENKGTEFKIEFEV